MERAVSGSDVDVSSHDESMASASLAPPPSRHRRVILRVILTDGTVIVKYTFEYWRHMPTRFKTAVYEQVARIGKATSSPARLEILELIAQAPRTVEAIAAEVGQSLANTSHHLQV